jgi:hypothetical protein
MRQVARLERRALPYIEEKRREQEEMEARLRERVTVIAAKLAFLILNGDPRIGEPLIDASRRCLESSAWKACREKHPDYIGSKRRDEGPINRRVAQYLRKYFLPDLPGADETEKLNRVFASAPAWLLWFTHGDVIGALLGLKVPDLSSMSRFARPEMSTSWGRLPDGPFEWREFPDGAEDEFSAMARDQLALPDNLTPRERMRALRLKQMREMSGLSNPPAVVRR